MKAVSELRLLGVFLTKEKIDREKVVVKVYQELQRAKKAKRKKKCEQKRMQKNISVFHEDQDDSFYYIAGYTSGGTPYGVTWVEVELQFDIENIGDKG